MSKNIVWHCNIYMGPLIIHILIISILLQTFYLQLWTLIILHATI
jgi:hypothetical protein